MFCHIQTDKFRRNIVNIYIAIEQQVVVECRVKQGYSCEMLSNGFYRLIKGRHTMVVNGLGYDTYVRGY